MNIFKQWVLYFILSSLHAVTNYVCFGVLSSIGYDGKTNSILFKVLGGVQQILWLPLGVLEHTKIWYILEWNYPLVLISNSFIAVGIVYLLILHFYKA